MRRMKKLRSDLSERSFNISRAASVRRERKAELAVFAELAFHVYFLAVRVYYGFCDIETEADAALVEAAALVRLIESVKYERYLRLCDADALIVDADAHLLAVDVC